MRRRRLLASLAATSLVAGCLEAVVDHLDPTATDPDWTPPIDSTDPAAHADGLAYVPLTLAGCTDVLGTSHPTTPTPLEDAPPAPVRAVLLITESADGTALEACPVVEATTSRYEVDPGAFLEDTRFDAAAIVAVAAPNVAAVSIDAVGLLPDGSLHAVVSLSTGDADRLALARVGLWDTPSRATLTVMADDDTVGTYEIDTNR